MRDFTEIRACRKAALAMEYSPDLAQHSATNRLNAWIKANAPLCEELATTGYTRRQRLLTARQVDIIMKHLGEP